MVKDYNRPVSLEAALVAMAAFPDASLLAGGTYLLAGYSFGSQIVRNPAAFLAKGDSRAAGSPPVEPERVIDIGRILPTSTERKSHLLRIGAGCSFQRLAESLEAPKVFKAAVLSMANRNIRNRATVGGNLAANKSCASLIPLLLALGAEVEYAIPGDMEAREKLVDWLAKPTGILLYVDVRLEGEIFASTTRSSRTACDLATSTVAVAFRKESGMIRDLRIAFGGFGPKARRFPEIESLFEGKAIPGQAAIEAAAAPLLDAIADQRGSAEFKRHRGAAMLADAFLAAEVIA